MAAKQSYKIPYGLEQSYSDMTIAMQSKDGSIGKVLPLIVVGTYVLSFLGCLFCVFKTPVGSVGTLPQIIAFILLWSALTVILTKYDGTRRMNVQRIMTLLTYLPHKSRYVYTRNNHDAGPFWNILGIDDVKPDGLILFADGTYGYIYRVVGSASILLFETDRDAIIDRVDKFFRKWDSSSEVMFITTKEAQKVYHQLYNLKQRYINLKNDDPDLRRVGEEQFRILRDHIGSEFKSIHQYMVLKSDSKETLRIANGSIESEVGSSSLMIKQCIPLDQEEIYQVLRSIYRKGDFINGNQTC